MNILPRCAALIAAIAINLVLFQSIALIGHPVSESQMLVAQINPPAVAR
jgi:hypothetical protein